MEEVILCNNTLLINAHKLGYKTFFLIFIIILMNGWGIKNVMQKMQYTCTCIYAYNFHV